MGHHGFGMGRRMCPGIDVTEAELLVACGSLCWGFELKPYLNSKGEPKWPDDKAFTPNLIGGPLPFEFDLKVRPDKRQRIIDLYEESVKAEAEGQFRF